MWTEPAATSGAANAWINDLDLEAVPPGASTYRGNVFASGSSTPGGSPDTRNNVEQIHIVSPATGLWTIRVKATAVNQGPQGYALVISGQVAEPSLCSGDANGDGRTDQTDFETVLFNFGFGS